MSCQHAHFGLDFSHWRQDLRFRSQSEVGGELANNSMHFAKANNSMHFAKALLSWVISNQRAYWQLLTTRLD